jgi:phosphonate transport system substrate-binding protein
MGFGSSVDRRGAFRHLAALGLGVLTSLPASADASVATEDAAAAEPAAETADRPLVLGVFPYLPALQIGRRFGALAGAVAELCDRPVSLQTKSSFPAFRQLLLDGHYDIALLHPFLYADATGVQDYRPLARLREDLRAVVIARTERPIERFADLRGAAIAVPPRLSAVAQLVQHELRREGLAGPDGVRLLYQRTKPACLHAVVSDAAVACALPGFALDQLEMFSPIALDAKFETPPIPGLVLVAHGRLGDEPIASLRQAVLGWADDPAGQQLLQALGWSGLVGVLPGEYDKARLALLVER